jgi:UDP-MurNAc hydroxylase
MMTRPPTTATSRVRYELVSHACVLFEFDRFKLLTDPWLLGPCYYGSWWHYPRPSRSVDTLQDVDLIVISHMHADHFHPPTLRRLPKHVPVWIPKLFFTDFRDRLRELGFQHVVEVPSGKTLSLPHGIDITNYSYRADDSAFVFEYDGRSWIHFNDCLLGGRTLARLQQRHSPVHTMFKIFANAEAYPACYESDDTDQLDNWSADTILDSFLETAELLQPQYAVPYGAFVRSFHHDSKFVNQSLIHADRVMERAVETGRGSDQVRILLPGDSWSSEAGFEIRARDPETEAARVEEREIEVGPGVREICEE